jgi:hypothetical protein
MDARHIATQQPSKNLDWKRLKPYEITDVIHSWVYQLQPPKDLQIHPVQPVSWLSKVSEDPLSRQIESAP